MSQVKIDSEDIAEIKNALTAISLVAQGIDYSYPYKAGEKLKIISEQVKRIDKLLPKVAWEGKE